jgi:hypothetical protein
MNLISTDLFNTATLIFKKYAKDKCHLSIFEAKLAILEITGRELTRERILKLVRDVDPLLNTNDHDSMKINQEIYINVIRGLIQEHFCNDELYEIYKEVLDKRNRGYFTFEEFNEVSTR